MKKRFSIKLPSFKIPNFFGKITSDPVLLSSPQPSQLIHTPLDLDISLNWNGGAEIGSPSWKVALDPVGISFPNPKLYRGVKLQLLRGDGVSTGFSFDKSSSRHFFILEKPPGTERFSLKFMVTNKFS